MKIVQYTWLTAVVICLGSLAKSAGATNVTVGCPGGQPGQFTRITDAMNSLDIVGPHSITVTGNCTESLFIGDRDGVTLAAPDGQTATINAANPADIVIQTFRARRITLRNLVVQHGSVGVLVNFGSDAVVQNCTMQGNSSDGLVSQQNASLVVENSTLQHNGGNGLTAASGANVTLSTYPDQRITLSNNGWNGINVDSAYVQGNFGTLTIQNNQGPAVWTSGGKLVIFGDSPVGPGNLIQNNGQGIEITNGTSAALYGQNLVHNNGQVGLQIDGSSVQAYGGALADGTPDGLVVEGHTVFGIEITGSAEVILGGQHVIRGNGSAGANPLTSSGVHVARASATFMGGAQITANLGPGIVADFNSSVQLGSGATITGNSGWSTLLLHRSVADVVSPLGLNQPMTCDESSLAFGNLAGLPINCNH